MRLRYEITRHFAPYIGVVWNRKLGNTADIARSAGGSVTASMFVVGFRTWP